MFKRIFRRNDDFDYYILSKNIKFYGILGAVMHMAFFMFNEFILDIEELFFVRVIMALLYIGFITFDTKAWSVFQKRYYDVVLIVSFPLFFGYMLILNQVDVFWSVSFLLGSLILVVFTRSILVALIQPIVIIAGGIISKYLFDYSNEEMYLLLGVYLLSLLLTIVLFVVKERFIDEVEQNRSLRESISNQNELLTSLIYISGELSMYDSIEVVFEVLVDRFSALLPDYSMGLYLSSGESQKILRSETNGLTEDDLSYVRKNFGQLTQAADTILSSGSITLKENWHVFNKEYTIINHSGEIEYNLMMLLVGEKITNYQIGFIQIFMEQISGNIRMRDQAKQLDLFSKTDQLTKMYNRNAYNQEINYQIRKYQEEHPFSIIFGDVNGLKYINDTYGHTDGDQLLSRCSELISEVIPSDWKVFRYGGDEVVILLEDAGLEEAMKIELLLDQKFLNQKMVCTSEVTGEKVSEDVAMSFGTICSREGEFEELIDLADVRMRKNKDAYYMKQQKKKYR